MPPESIPLPRRKSSMPLSQPRPETVALLGPPYRHLIPVDRTGPGPPREGGWVLTWHLGAEDWLDAAAMVANRRAGIALAIILPDGDNRPSITPVLRAIEQSRPQAVLPFHEAPCPTEIAGVIRRPPLSLSSSVSEYLDWRGFALDPVARNIIRRIVELSDRAQTISALATNLYMSRRALGRRLLKSSLPVPSHWLHISRILRATFRLQNSDATLFHVACSLGYPDGFSLSNQMSRLCGVRPLEVRDRIGWEWLFENWLAREEAKGNLPKGVARARPSIALPPAEPSRDADSAARAAISI